MSCDEDVLVGWLHALCIEQSNMHLFRFHLLPSVIMLDQSLCCLPTKRYLRGWLVFYPSKPSPGGVGGS